MNIHTPNLKHIKPTQYLLYLQSSNFLSSTPENLSPACFFLPCSLPTCKIWIHLSDKNHKVVIPPPITQRWKLSHTPDQFICTLQARMRESRSHKGAAFDFMKVREENAKIFAHFAKSLLISPYSRLVKRNQVNPAPRVSNQPMKDSFQ